MSTNHNKPCARSRRRYAAAGRALFGQMGKRLNTQWTVTPRPNPRAALRLICVPDAGGGIATFRGWSERVPSAEVSVVQLPGRGSRQREPLGESAVVAADRIV